MDDGALYDGFSERNRSWDDSGTIISDTKGTYQNFMGSRMPDLQFIFRMDRTLHPCWQEIIEKSEKSNIPTSLGKTKDVFKKNKDSKQLEIGGVNETRLLNV